MLRHVVEFSRVNLRKPTRLVNSIAKPIANPVAVLREEFDEWALLFNPDTAEVVATNPVGAAVWKLLDGRNDLESILTEIREQFAAVPEVADQEIGAFIDDLAARGFVGYELETSG